MIFHYFTIILGVREKKSRVPPHEQKQIAYPVREFSQALRGPKTRTPQPEGYGIVFFRVPGTKRAKRFFRVPGTRGLGVRLFRYIE